MALNPTTAHGGSSDWIQRNGYRELVYPQLSLEWQQARRYRLTGSSWHTILTSVDRAVWTQVANAICADRPIQFDPSLEDRARAQLRQDYPGRYPVEDVPSLCIPDPDHLSWAWLPPDQRALLIHLGGSPDLRGPGRVAEIKCPGRIRGHLPEAHHWQLQCNMLVTNTHQSDYYQYQANGRYHKLWTLHREPCRTQIHRLLRFIESEVVPRLP